MQVTKTYCDRCQKEITGTRYRVPKYVRDGYKTQDGWHDSIFWAESYQWDDCCEDCAKKFQHKVLDYALTVKPSQHLIGLLEKWLLVEHAKDIADIFDLEKGCVE